MIKPILDASGKLVNGTYRDPNGAIIIKNDSELDKYKREVKRIETVNKMENRIDKLQQDMETIMTMLENLIKKN